MVFPAFSKDHFHMTQQCIKLVLNLEYTIEQKLFSIFSKKAEFFHSEWCAISLVKLTCLDQTILPETVGKSLTLLILQAVLWMYWTYKQIVTYPCSMHFSNNNATSTNCNVQVSAHIFLHKYSEHSIGSPWISHVELQYRPWLSGWAEFGTLGLLPECGVWQTVHWSGKRYGTFHWHSLQFPAGPSAWPWFWSPHDQFSHHIY